MTKAYFDYLPRNYFQNLYQKVAKTLMNGNSVCVSVMSGCGGRTFLNLFLKFSNKDRLFKKFLYLDPEVDTKPIIDRVNQFRTAPGQKLIILRLNENIPHKTDLFEKLNRLRYPEPQNLVFLVITDHSGITSPKDYTGRVSSFFTNREYIRPFSKGKETQTMITALGKQSDWKISAQDTEVIQELSGGIPRLIKFICKDHVESGLSLNDPKTFLSNPAINLQLTYLTRLLVTQPTEILTYLGLVSPNKKVIGKLLEIHFANFESEHLKSLYPNLTTLESKLFSYLIENKDQLVTVDKIADLIELSGSEFSLWAIYKLISRLKKKILKHFEIDNLKARGYILRTCS